MSANGLQMAECVIEALRRVPGRACRGGREPPLLDELSSDRHLAHERGDLGGNRGNRLPHDARGR
jgi:hypothetical protein